MEITRAIVRMKCPICSVVKETVMLNIDGKEGEVDFLNAIDDVTHGGGPKDYRICDRCHALGKTSE